MALPVEIVTRTVTYGPETDFQGNSITGSLTFTPSEDITWVAAGQGLHVKPITVNLNSSGSGSIDLICTDQTGFRNANGQNITNWFYTVTADLVGVPGSTRKFVVPSGVGSLDLDTMIPITTGTTTISVPVIVNSVAGRTGAVTLTKNDVGLGSLDANETALRIAADATKVDKGALVFNVKDYGAVGDGTTVDTTAVQAAITAAHAVGGEVMVPSGTFMVDGLLSYGGVTVRGVGDTSVLKHITGGGAYLLSVNPNSGGSSDPTTNETGIRFRDLKFMGRSGTFVEHDYILNLNAVTDVKIERCSFKGWGGDAIYLGSGNTGGIERHNRKVRVIDCDFDGVDNLNRNAVSVIDGDGVWIERCIFANISRSDMPGAVDVEPNSTTFSICRNVWIRGNTFKNITCGTGAVTLSLAPQAGLTVPARGFWIEDNSFDLDAVSPAIRISTTTEDPDSTTIPQAVVVRGNRVFGSGRALSFYGVRGVRVTENYVTDSALSSIIGGYPGRRAVDVTINDNHFRNNCPDPAGNGMLFSVNNATRITVKDNTFDNNGRSDNSTGVVLALASTAGATSDQMSMQRNNIFGARTTKATAVGASHVTNAVSNDYTDNQDTSVLGCDVNFGSPAGDAADPFTVDYSSNYTTATIGTANDARILRSKGSGVVSKIALHVTVSSGNISVGVYRQNGLRGKLSRPATLIATSGAVACPAIGYAEITISPAVQVRKGDYLALSCDNTTATFSSVLSNGITSAIWDGIAYQNATAHPLPSTLGSLVAATNRVPILRGIA